MGNKLHGIPVVGRLLMASIQVPKSRLFKLFGLDNLEIKKSESTNDLNEYKLSVC